MTRIKANIVTICIILLFSFSIVGCSKEKSSLDKPTSTEISECEVHNETNVSELEFKNGTRTFKSEVNPKSEAEAVIVEILKIEISDSYDKFKDLHVKGEQFNNFPEVYMENFKKGLYTEEINIHSLRNLSKEEYLDNPNSYGYYPYMDRLKKAAPHEFQIIEIKYTKKVTEELNKIAQWGSGNWTRFYVMVKEDEKSNWRVYDIYGHM